MSASWQLGPVVRGMRGHRAAAALVVVQLAIGLAITVLAALMGDYFVRYNAAPSSLPEDDLTIVELQRAGRADRARLAAGHAALVDGIRALPGAAAAATLRLPLAALEHAPDDLRTTAAAAPVGAYAVLAGAGIAGAAGLRLRAGRDLSGDDVARPGERTAAIVSVRLARALWPGRDPLGATFESRGRGPAVVVGVIDDVRSRLFGRDEQIAIYAGDDPRAARVVLLVRSEPGRAAELRRALAVHLRAPGQHAEVASLAAHTSRRAAPVEAVVGILSAMVAAIVVVILTGSMGLTYFLVARRTREIGLRRAMGATRKDVVRHLVLENLLYTAAGALLGLAIVLATLPAMARAQEDFVVRWPIVGLAVATVAALNLLATFIPASRAAMVPPAVASRSS